jgi:hypothetical protein
MKGLAQLEDMRVITEDGMRLGRIFEIRSPGKAETEPTYAERPIECLLCGRRGWLERLGWVQRTPRAIPWSSVVGLRDGALLVKSRADGYEPREAP